MPRQSLAGIPERTAKQFLLRLANLPDESADDDVLRTLAAFEDRYSEIIPSHWSFSGREKKQPQRLYQLRDGSSGLLALIDVRNIFLTSSQAARNALRAIWLAPNYRTKEWGVFRLIEAEVIRSLSPPPDTTPATFRIEAGIVAPLPPPGPLEQCLRYLLRNASKVAVCRNPDCPAPYFLATRRSQKYCTAECARPAQREFKLAWWNKTGKHQRARQRKAGR